MTRNSVRRAVSAVALIGAILHSSSSYAQISTDGTLGAKQVLRGPAFDIPASLGQQRGANLFFSFATFNVGTGESANFSGPNGIQNIVSRVTGREVSYIDGPLGSSIPGVNFYLLNPSGVLTGPNASLNVGGSVHLTTADAVRFADGKAFSVTAPAPLLSVAAPTAFGFLGTAPALIQINGSKLSVQSGQTLSLLGGQIAISSATLAAPGGRVQIASLASGEVALDGTVTPSSRLGAVTIANSLVGATGFDENGIGLGSGTVVIRGGQLLVDASNIVAHTWEDVPGPRLIDIQVTGDVVLTNGAKISSTTFTADRGGDVKLIAARLRLENQSVIETKAFAEGDGGDVAATVGRLSIVGGSIIGSTTDFSSGHGGNITVEADVVTISGRDSANNPSGVFSDALADGSGGKISIRPRASGLDLVMDDIGTIASRTLGTDAFFGGGSGGDIEVNATNLSVLGGATIGSLTAATAPGGNIALTAANSVIISGGDSLDPTRRSGISSGSFGAADTGTPGHISVTTGTFTLTQGGAIQSGGAFAPEAGDIDITARNALIISKDGNISSQAFAQPGGQVSLTAPAVIMDDGFVNTSTIGSGSAGNVVVNAGRLTMSNGAQIASSSSEQSTAPGGIVTVKANDSVSITGRSSSVNSFTNDASSGLFSTTASPDPLGSAGKVVVTAPRLSIADGGKISVASTGVASAGDIALTVGTLSLSSGGGLFSNATSSGPGGSIDVQARQVLLSGGAAISATSTGPALAGNVTIAANTFQTLDSFVTTEARQADGGDIDIAVGSMLYLRGSRITTSVGAGAGKGGNITIDPQFVVLNDSQVLANAFGGPGGNIGIVTDVFLAGDSVVNASSALNAPGTININARITNLSDSLVQLPDNVLQAATLLRAACSARVSEGKASSLVVSGREGLPPGPEGLLWSPLGSALTDVSVAPSEGYTEQFLQFVGLWLGPNCAR